MRGMWRRKLHQEISKERLISESVTRQLAQVRATHAQELRATRLRQIVRLSTGYAMIATHKAFSRWRRAGHIYIYIYIEREREREGDDDDDDIVIQ